jgi:signal transduction histidine kinase
MPYVDMDAATADDTCAGYPLTDKEDLTARLHQQAVVAELGRRALTGVPISRLMDDAVSLVAEALAADYCKILELQPDRTSLLLRAGVGWRPDTVGRALVGAGRDSQAGYTLLSDGPVIVDDLRTETRFNGPPLLHDHGVISGASVIIPGRAEPFGVLGVHTTKPRRFTTHDIDFLQAVAHLLTVANERKETDETRDRLLAAEREARAETNRLAERIVRLLQAAVALSAASTPEEVADIAIKHALAALGAEAGTLLVLLDRAEPAAIFRTSGNPRAFMDRWSRAPAHALVPLAEAVRSRTPVFLGARDAHLTADPGSPEQRAIDGEATLAIPLFADRRLTGVFGLYLEEAREFDDADRTFLLALAQLSAEAIERARLRSAEWTAGVDADVRSQLTLLAEASAQLFLSLDQASVLDALCSRLVPCLADAALAYRVSEQGVIQLPPAVSAVPALDALVRALACCPLPQDGAHPVVRVLQTRRPEILTDLSAELLERSAIDAPQIQLLRQIQPISLVALPLAAHERVVGVLWLISGRTTYRHGSSNLALIEEVARQAAMASQHACLFESERCARRAAEQAVSARDRFLASTSHELRTPLANIKGFITSLLRPDVDWDRQTQHDFLAQADHEIERLDGMVADLLDLARLERKGLDGCVQTLVQPATLLASGIARVGSILEQGRVVVELAPGVKPVRVSLPDMERVIGNIVENAAKYTPSGSPLHISCHEIGTEIEMRFQDTGPGVPEHELGRIFEEFYRLPNSRQSGVRGTGLGLAICKRIVEAHEGTIWAESNASGLCVVIRLPLDQ